MKSFLTKVKKATAAMGEAPYDDKKTFLAVSQATKKTIETYESLKKTRVLK